MIHLSRDLDELNRWYIDAFGVVGFWGWPEPDYFEPERRLASMFMLGDVCIETVAPADPDDTSTALGRALARRGAQIYSIAFRDDDLVGRGRRLTDAGVEVGELSTATRFFVPHPRHTAGVRVEFLNVPFGDEPSDGLAFDHLTARVEDVASARDRFVDLLGADAGADDASVSLAGAAIRFVPGSPPGWAGLTFTTSSADGAAVVEGHGVQLTVRERVPSG